MPETDRNGAEHIAGQILAGLALSHNASPVADTVTASIGICSMIPQRGLESRYAVKAADEALCSAKNNGRNCYVVSVAKPRSALIRP